MTTSTIVFLVIIVVLIAALVALYFFGKKAQRRQAVQQDERFTEWLDESAALNNLYIETRYPTDLPLSIDERACRKYFAIAENMFAAIRQELYDAGMPHRIKH